MLRHCECGREAEFIHASGNSRYPLCPECFLRWKELVPGAIEQAMFEFEDGSEYTAGTVIDECKEGHVMLKMSNLWLSAVRWKEQRALRGGANPGDNQAKGE